MNRILGINGPAVSAVGLGCYGMSGAYGAADEPTAIATIERALELGHNFLDTADFYATGHNERLIGRAIRGKREQAFLSVKSGQLLVPGPNKTALIGPVNGRPDYLRNAVLYSLERLGTDYIDLYSTARVDPQVPIEETIGALAELVQQGLVRYIGLSEASVATIRRAAAVHLITALQMEYSLWSRELESEVLPTLRELGIGLVGYSPLSRGLLSGGFKAPADVTDYRQHMPRFQGENFHHNRLLVDQLETLASAKGCSPSQLAIAWVLAQGEDIITIPGTKRLERLEENLAAEQVHLTAEDLRLLEGIMPAGSVAGTRYPEKAMQHLNN
jgi:aryl-alcohol dehydrogenase-like predicted oxidoreductase